LQILQPLFFTGAFRRYPNALSIILRCMSSVVPV